MKTVTEFFGKSLKTLEEQLPAFTSELTKSITETMKAEGKSEEEIAAGLPVVLKTQLDAKISEVQKVEGDKLAMLMGALSVIKGRRGNLKRVIVMVPMVEGEKAPSGAIEVEGKFFVSEFFPEPTRAHKGSGRDDGKFDARGGRDGKRGGKGGRGGKDGGRGGRGRDDRGAGAGRGAGRGPGGPGGDRPRGPRRSDSAPLEAGAVVIGGGGTPGGEGGQRRNPRPPRAPRPPREPRAPRAPREGERVRQPGEKWTIIPRSEMPVAAAASTTTETASSTESQSS